MRCGERCRENNGAERSRADERVRRTIRGCEFWTGRVAQQSISGSRSRCGGNEESMMEDSLGKRVFENSSNRQK